MIKKDDLLDLVVWLCSARDDLARRKGIGPDFIVGTRDLP